MLKGLMGALFPQGGAKFKDAKGLFRGGDEGRGLGRLKDALGIASRDSSGNKVSMENVQGGGDDLLSHARAFAENLKTDSADDVLEMQGLLNQLGIKDSEGKELLADGILGEKTLGALRQLQGSTLEPDQMQNEFPGNDLSSNVSKLFGGGSDRAGAFEVDRNKKDTAGSYGRYLK